MKYRIILQSRTTSKRLPGKSLISLCNTPLTVLCAKRLKNKKNLIIATSNNKSDDKLCKILEKNRIKFFRGSLNNVLSRFYYSSLDLKDEDIIIRATADNPIPDANLVKKCLKIFKEKKYKYLYFDSPKNGLAFGLCIEIFFVKELRKAYYNSKSSYDKEHVATWIKRNIKNKKNLSYSDLKVKKTNNLKCSIDTFDDYLRMLNLFKFYKNDFTEVSWKNLLTKLLELDKLSNLSRIGIGTANFGMNYGIKKKKIDSHKTNKILRFAEKKGINFIDTARIYGEAETKIKSFKYNIFTKLDTFGTINNYSSLSNKIIKQKVSESISKSLECLGKKSIEVVFLHDWKQYSLKKKIMWKELIRLKRGGIINSLGASVDNVKEATQALNEKNIKHLQIPFNILDYRWHNIKFRKLLDNRPDVKIYARSIFLQGLLLSKKNFWPSWVDSNKILTNINNLKKKFNFRSNLELCLRYALYTNWISHIILGIDNKKQLENILSISKKPHMSEEMIYKIKKTFVNIPDRLIKPYEW